MTLRSFFASVGLSLAWALAGCSSSDAAGGSSSSGGSSGAPSDAGISSDGASSSSAPSALACDKTLLDPAAADFIRVPTAEELAKYVKTYTGSVYGADGGTTDGPAELKADGKLTMVGQTYSPTSYCFETTVGDVDYGNTLYVHFAGGKADLWEKNGKYAGSLDP